MQKYFSVELYNPLPISIKSIEHIIIFLQRCGWPYSQSYSDRSNIDHVAIVTLSLNKYYDNRVRWTYSLTWSFDHSYVRSIMTLNIHLMVITKPHIFALNQHSGWSYDRRSTCSTPINIKCFLENFCWRKYDNHLKVIILVLVCPSH